MSEFKVGDEVETLSGDSIGKIQSISEMGVCTVYWNDGDVTRNESYGSINLRKSGENKMKELKKSKFMIYGTGCDNKSRLLESKKEATEKAKEVVYDSAWTGDIIIYELKPLSIAEKSIKLKSIK